MNSQIDIKGGSASGSMLHATPGAEMRGSFPVVEMQPRVPISQTLRQLNVGESVKFPWEQRASLLAIANRIKKELARHGWDYTYTDDTERFLVVFTRIQ